MKSRLFLIALFAVIVAVISLGAVLPASAEEESYPDRGRYIYDDADRLPLEAELSLSSYLWRLDNKTDYEIIIVFPNTKFNEDVITKWFNGYGVGKSKKDNGAAIFVFPDNSVFVAIGSGNDKVSVAQSITKGNEILKDLNKDLVLSLLRFINVFAGKIIEPTNTEKGGGLGEAVQENLHLIFLWALVLSLIVFLIQQINGFQGTDLILPVVLLILAGIFAGISFVGGDNDMVSKEYGVITSTQHDTRHWVEVITTTDSAGNTYTYTIPHTDYINLVSILSYDLKPYRYKFVTTDNRGAWERVVGEFDALTINAETGSLYSADRFNDKSGGKMIGDGVWINAGTK